MGSDEMHGPCQTPYFSWKTGTGTFVKYRYLWILVYRVAILQSEVRGGGRYHATVQGFSLTVTTLQHIS